MRNRSVNLLLIVAAVTAIVAPLRTVRAQGTAFIHNGQLNDGNSPANDTDLSLFLRH